jgi:hypothetical protein
MNLVNFYLGTAPDYQGRMLRDIWTWDHERLEQIHDFIQVLFPLAEPSMFSSRAPILRAEDVREFRNNAALRDNLLRSFRLMLDFYGLEMQEDPVAITKAAHFPERAVNWLAFGDHNMLRITRILKCLRLCGFGENARAFLAFLLNLYEERPRDIGMETLAYWQDAVNESRGSSL